MDNEESKLNFPKREEEILEFWEKNKIFEESIKQRKGKKKFVFYEGPPTANGQPGLHHVEARAFKDIILRYKTMRGFYCERKAGWDTHGLPVEIQIEKELGLKSKKEIEEYGIEKFIEKCKESVWRYRNEWEKLTERMAYWLDMKNAYATMTNDYIETLWWIFKETEKRKLLYEGYKVLPWCPRCGTALSTHEVSQGYRKVKEESIYIRFKVKSKDSEWQNTSILVWTTTPWTLPSNAALAINSDIEYVCVPDPEEENHWLVLGKKNFEILLGKGFFPETYKNLPAFQIDSFSGREMVGLEYEPLYPDNAPYKVYAADFVSAEEGTGVVHIAPAYGEDDMRLGKAEKLPILSLVDEEGKMLKPGYKWNGMFIKDADPLIVEGLRQRKLLFKTEPYEHDYPFCWRCDSPLMYYAKTSWWLKTTAVKQKMIAENKKINWHPEYLKEGRFGEWLKDLRDWAISRERYWGTPLPIWRCGACKNYSVIGSYDELKKKTLKSGNKYFVMRHGFAEHNSHDIASSNIENDNYKLLPKGKKEIAKTAAKLKKEKIDLIFSSDFLRTKETAAAVADIIGIPKENIFFDARLRDVNVGIFDAKPDEEYHRYFSSNLEKFSKAPPNGENLTDLKNRLMRFLYEMEEKYKERNILIITHEYPTWLIQAGAKGLTDEEAVILKGKKKDFIGTGQMMKLDFIPLSHNQNFVLDPHRPYIDKILLKCEKCGGEMKRINGVCDVWFDSGAMPFAQNHYPFDFAQGKPFANKKLEYPADYICEAIDQTRGWFYTLLADAILLGRKAPYRNVLSLGLVLDANGQKMSKSKGNIVLPIDLMNKYGADAVRWYFYTINQPWDEKLFKESDVQAVLRRFILIFWNCFTYWKIYGRAAGSRTSYGSPTSIINKWLLARFNQVALEATKMLDNYDVVSTGRLLENFVIEDISHWYIRRIREKMKNPNSKEAKEINAVLGKVIMETAKILAPFTPFISEMMYQEMNPSSPRLRSARESVHLENYPVVGKTLSAASKKLLKDMEVTRDIVSKALEVRTKFGIRVRQPIASLKIKSQISPASPRQSRGRANLKNNKELLELIKGEVNVKEIIFDKNIKEEIELDTMITQELREEGILRDLIRQIQDIRKKEGRKPNEMLEFFMATDEKGKNFIVKYAKEFKKSINAKSIIVRSVLEGGYDVKVGEFVFLIKSEK
ncbi:MAG: isoleucine--tRNA ligase [Candidatus Tagabacteria bacterium CG03_land_8_20_14_0_80_41_22]|uniref:Isoleucine--tRNA ligase n=3 Tax=Candidatus Tagaibacteriota TaxID=1817918 RepID=A0A2M7B8W7_9BACT|nr:MAG: isoleucine--tRNA ligase [Candidatus Tagabacteria bacterium CG03_land_8_20_14_0_80_41_22]